MKRGFRKRVSHQRKKNIKMSAKGSLYWLHEGEQV
jgi:hypothetical protein